MRRVHADARQSLTSNLNGSHGSPKARICSSRPSHGTISAMTSHSVTTRRTAPVHRPLTIQQPVCGLMASDHAIGEQLAVARGVVGGAR